MNHWKERIHHIFHPGKILSVLIPLGGFGSLIAVFSLGLSKTALGYASYVLSFYSLLLCLTQLIPLTRQLASRTLQKPAAGIRSLLRRRIPINTAFAVYNLGSGFYYGSVWLISCGGYYLTLGILRLYLLRYARLEARAETQSQKLQLGWKGFRRCGMWMLLVNLAMSGMVAQMIWQGQGSHYGEITVIAIAAYTFYKLTLAIIQVARRQGKTDPIDGAARNLDLTEALMSLYSLQAALLHTFGGGDGFRLTMNLVTGVAVCALTTFGALGMWLHGRKQHQ